MNLLSVIALRVRPGEASSGGHVNTLTLLEQGWKHDYVRTNPGLVDAKHHLQGFAGRWHSDDSGAEIVIEAAPAEAAANELGRMRVRGLYGRANYRLLPLVEGGVIVQNVDGEVPMHGILRRVGNDLLLSTMRTQNLRLKPGAGE